MPVQCLHVCSWPIWPHSTADMPQMLPFLVFQDIRGNHHYSCSQSVPDLSTVYSVYNGRGADRSRRASFFFLETTQGSLQVVWHTCRIRYGIFLFLLSVSAGAEALSDHCINTEKQNLESSCSTSLLTTNYHTTLIRTAKYYIWKLCLYLYTEKNIFKGMCFHTEEITWWLRLRFPLIDKCLKELFEDVA